MAKKKAHAEEHVNHERWLITYADMLTLLMVLFVVLYSMSATDAVKFLKLKQSLNRAFDVEVLQAAEPTNSHGDGGPSFISPMMDPQTAQEVRMMTGGSAPDPKVVSALQDLRQAVIQIPIPANSSGHVEVGISREGIVISLAGNLLFDSGKSDLKPQGLVLLDSVAERLKTMTNEIRIEGHTDNVPIATPLYPSNWELSSARAITVARYFSESDEISATRLSAAGYGEFRPVDSNDTREGRARNRRVDLVILFPQLQMQPDTAAGTRPTQREALP
jgi:chemotaxis protein MotB